MNPFTEAVSGGLGYGFARGNLTFDERTVTARFQLYPASPATFWIDELFLTPTGEGG